MSHAMKNLVSSGGSLADRLAAVLGADSRMVAITFHDSPPEGVARIDAPAPAGCAYWRAAAEGRTFFTEAEDHLGCPIGAHTHHAPMDEAKGRELEGMLQTMVGLKYLKLAEVPAIPRRTTPLKVAVYAPLARAEGVPDVVLVRGRAKAMMLLAEAAQAAGLASTTPAMGRPTCAVIPGAMASGRAAHSFGCIGNRVYTGASDDDAYFAIPGASLAELTSALETIAHANVELAKFHTARAAAALQNAE
jgi:uncharacterized protein (DUF169 family)